MRVALVHNIIAPYRLDLFNLLADEDGIDLRVFFLAVSEADRAWDDAALRSKIHFPYEILQGIHLRIGRSTIHINPGLVFRLKAFNPERVISVSLTLATALCWVYCRLSGKPLLVWWAGTGQTEADISHLKRLWRRWLIPKVACFLAYSEGASAYLRSQGVEPRRIIVVGNISFDVRAYRERVENQRHRAEQLRQSIDLAGKRMILAVGQFIPRKNHKGLILVFKEIIKSTEDVGLVIVGDGPQRENLQTLGAHIARGLIQFPGHIEPDELTVYYAAADLFVHLALRDHWAQVVNEAMASGLPVVVSKFDHASEMVDQGVNGYKVDPHDADSIIRICCDLLISPDKAKGIGERGYQTALSMDVNHVRDAFLQAIWKGSEYV
jgi:glycosyltransferase involved in cell wall biosynthesis